MHNEGTGATLISNWPWLVSDLHDYSTRSACSSWPRDQLVCHLESLHCLFRYCVFYSSRPFLGWLYQVKTERPQRTPRLSARLRLSMSILIDFHEIWYKGSRERERECVVVKIDWGAFVLYWRASVKFCTGFSTFSCPNVTAVSVCAVHIVHWLLLTWHCDSWHRQARVNVALWQLAQTSPC